MEIERDEQCCILASIYKLDEWGMEEIIAILNPAGRKDPKPL